MKFRGQLRTLGLQRLDDRRLMVAEGTPIVLDAASFAEGLSQNVAGVWDFGDGTTSSAAVQRTGQTGDVRVRFDYSLDRNGFFRDTNRRQILQSAADAVVSRFGDQLAAVSVTSEFLSWEPRIFDPSTGADVSVGINPSLAAGEIVIYVGSRDLPGSTLGLGGPAGDGTSFSFTASSQAEADRIQAEIDANIELIRSRGQNGVTTAPVSDYAVTFGSIAFDSDESRFSFNQNPVTPDTVDFYAIAQHEIAHVLGFGVATKNDLFTPWQRFGGGGRFDGPASTAVYLGSGGVPIESNHFEPEVGDLQPTVMTPRLVGETAPAFSELDFASLQDLGWQINAAQFDAETNVVYADDGTFTPTLRLRGGLGGEQIITLDPIVVTNVAPNVTAFDPITVTVGNQFLVTDLVMATDAGVEDTFIATIDWGDGTNDSGDLTIDRRGTGASDPTSASIDAAHTYADPGTYTVTMTVTDDDGGQNSATSTITVVPELNSNFQNTRNRFDVDDDNDVDTDDIISIINVFRRDGPGPLIGTRGEDDLFVDVDGDGSLAIEDILAVVNEFRRTAVLGGEAESIDDVDRTDATLYDEVITSEFFRGDHLKNRMGPWQLGSS